MMTAYLRPNLENVQKAEDDKFSLVSLRDIPVLSGFGDLLLYNMLIHDL